MANSFPEKRPRDEPAGNSKRYRSFTVTQHPLPDLRSPSRAALQLRLTRLFPSKPQPLLESVISMSSNNLEVCMLLLQKDEFDQQIRTKVLEYSNQLTESLNRAIDIRTAENITKEHFNAFFIQVHENVNKLILLENRQLTTQVQALAEDSKLLKRAVLKLYNKQEREQLLETELTGLWEQLREEKLLTYSLQMQLAQCYSRTAIGPSRELF